MLKIHLYILTAFVLLAVPVYLVDSLLLKPQRYGSFLDLGGLFLLPYLAFAAGHIAYSSLGLWLFRPNSLMSLHIISAMLSVLSIGVAIYIAESYGSMKTREALQEKMKARAMLYDDVVLEKWWYVPDTYEPQTVYAEISFKRSGRFSANMTARELDKNSEMKFWAEMGRPVSVNAGDRQIVKMAVTRELSGGADYVKFSLFLFPENPTQSGNNITKIYIPIIDQKDDGEYMYDTLPERSSAP
ncbi:MAG: hypothetical protein JJ879_16610 [Sneathiella sp.]|nr:hypothetical protein [Sneathiella sp.]